MYNSFSETAIYSVSNGLIVTDHRHFMFKLTHFVNKNTNSNVFHLDSFDIKEQNVFDSSKSQTKVFLNPDFPNFFGVLSNFIKRIKILHFKRLDKKDLSSLEKDEKKESLSNLFLIIQNKLNLLQGMFKEYKVLLENEYNNMYDFYLLRSAIHICQTKQEQLYFHFTTNEYNQHQLHFLSNLLINNGFYKLEFENHSNTIDWFFEDYKFFKFIEIIDKTSIPNKDKFRIKSDILDCLDYLKIIDSQKRYFIKDLYKKKQEG